MKKLILLFFGIQTILYAIERDDDEIDIDYAARAESLYQEQLEIQKNMLDMNLATLIFKDAPKSLHRIMRLLLHRKNNTNILPKSILLVGNPGLGKSTLARAIAVYNEIPYLFIECPLLANEYKYSGSQNLYRLITPILLGKQPCFIILDEINALIDKSNNPYEQEKDTILAFISLFDKLQEENPLAIIIATTNSLEKFPDPIKNRFQECIELVTPNIQSRKEIIKFHFYKKGILCNEAIIHTITKNTYNFSGRDLEHLINIITSYAAMHTRIDEKIIVNNHDIYQAFKELKNNKLLNHIHASYFSRARSFVKNNINYIIPIVGMVLTCITIYQQYIQHKESSQLTKISIELTKKGLGLQETGQSQQEQTLTQQQINNGIGIANLCVNDNVIRAVGWIISKLPLLC